MTKKVFEQLSKSYFKRFSEGLYSKTELIGLLKILVNSLNGKTYPAFRFGKNNTVFYFINEIERDLLSGTKENKQFLREQIEYASNNNEIEVIYN